MKYAVNKEERPVYLQLYRLIRDDIIGGVFPHGSRLPSKRLLAEESGVSTPTVEHAYALLCDEGYAESRERSGFFVIFRKDDGFAVSAPVCREKETPIVQGSSYPVFSVATLSRTMRHVLSERQDTILERSPGQGMAELRGAIRDYLARNRGIKVDTFMPRLRAR